MQRRTAVVLVAFCAALVALVLFGLGTATVQTGFTETWVSDTARDIDGNHHAVAVAQVDGRPLVYAPVSGRVDTADCELAALSGDTGEERWDYQVPEGNCAIHAVADPTVADYDQDGTAEVLAATTEERLIAADPLSGDIEFTYDLSSYGYSQPLVANVTGDARPEIVVVDVTGTVFVIRSDGSTAWTYEIDSYTWGQPAVADFDGDDTPEVAVGAGASGELYLFEHDGTRAWESPVEYDSSITWMTTGHADSDGIEEVVIATALKGRVSMVEGDRETVWTRDLGSFAAVHNITDGDEDGDPEVYAVANNGVLTSLDAATGDTEWTTTLTEPDVQMMPPPAVGDVDGDGQPEIVAVTNDGRVSLVDPKTGEVLQTHQREDSIFTHPTLADVDGDGDVEAFVIYGSGRVARFDSGEN